MKLVRFGKLGAEKPGVIDKAGNLRDLSSVLPDINPTTIAHDLINRLQQLDFSHLPLIASPPRIGPCVGNPGKLLCVGYNSKLHNEQMGVKPFPKEDMLVFMKPVTAICGPNDPILYGKHMKKLDWEAELGIVIGKKGKYIPTEEAANHILGYTCINDLSERFLQFETCDTQYTKGKGFDNAAPIGPYLVTRDEIIDSSNLTIQLFVNEVLRQDFNTSDYIHNDVAVVCYLSQYFTLYPGDIISMGSAPGNAKSWGNQFLKPTDRVKLTISSLGTQEQVVILEE